MARKQPKPKPIKDRRNGLKDKKLIEQNNLILKNLKIK